MNFISCGLLQYILSLIHICGIVYTGIRVSGIERLMANLILVIFYFYKMLLSFCGEDFYSSSGVLELSDTKAFIEYRF